MDNFGGRSEDDLGKQATQKEVRVVNRPQSTSPCCRRGSLAEAHHRVLDCTASGIWIQLMLTCFSRAHQGEH